MTDLVERAKTWIDADPDPATRAELTQLIANGDIVALGDRFDGELTFGTAGIRGEVGAGPNRMNRAVVIRATRGLAEHLIASHGPSPERPVVIGYDARPTSLRFAEDAAGVLAAAGIAVLYFDEVTPTPLVAFAAKHLHSLSAVVITASHNPPSDNGYKLYAENAAQIIPPDDVAIAAAISAVGRAVDVPRVEGAFGGASDLVRPVPTGIFDCYWEEVSARRPDPRTSNLKVVYTPLHGVGGRVLEKVFHNAGHDGLAPVTDQFEPDGRFPTVAFPNPEEKGALDLAMKAAREGGADIVIANDPDADRLAVVVPERGGEWRPLSGNEVGVLLGDYILRNHQGDSRAIVVSSIVSSPMLASIAALYGARHEVTLTGFKWIVNAGLALEGAGEGTFVFGYEEALGYAVGPAVRDKDGISAALVFTDLVAGLRAGGSTVLDRLVELWDAAGLWVSAQHSVKRPGPGGMEAIEEAVGRLADNPPPVLGGHPVSASTDFREGSETRPRWLGAETLVELNLGERGRVLARPSGTEPKLKIYVDLRGECGNDAFGNYDKLKAETMALATEVAKGLGI